MEIRVCKTSSPKDKFDPEKVAFGTRFTDHMFVMDFQRGKGWFDPRIIPYGDLQLDPATVALHYGTEIFEGLKAYRNPQGGVHLFRPIENVRRLNNSAERLCMPTIDEGMAMAALSELVRTEKSWVPDKYGTSLYLRPFMLGSDVTLSLHSLERAVFVIIASPVGNYYTEGLNPVRILIEDEDVRAVRGGTGYAKCGGNYAASSRAGEKAEKLGYSQVLWLDGVERKYVEEVGAMNVMFKIDGEIVTPALTGSILPGITRKSCIELLESEGYKVAERKISVDELIEALENGKLEEAWGCGTAAVISPIGEFIYKDKKIVVNNNEIGKTTQHLYDALTGIQWGTREDSFGWLYPIE